MRTDGGNSGNKVSPKLKKTPPKREKDKGERTLMRQRTPGVLKTMYKRLETRVGDLGNQSLRV